MDFIEKIGDTITAKGKEAADKAKELAEIANLKGQISTCENIIKRNYTEIGRIYFELYGDCPEEPFEKQCRSVRNARNGIKEIQEQIIDLKAPGADYSSSSPVHTSDGSAGEGMDTPL